MTEERIKEIVKRARERGDREPLAVDSLNLVRELHYERDKTKALRESLIRETARADCLADGLNEWRRIVAKAAENAFDSTVGVVNQLAAQMPPESETAP